MQMTSNVTGRTVFMKRIRNDEISPIIVSVSRSPRQDAIGGVILSAEEVRICIGVANGASHQG